MWKLIFFFLWIAIEVQAQSPQGVNKKAFELFQRARKAFREGEREKAFVLLEKAKTYDRKFSEIYLLEADIYNKYKDKVNEIKAIETALTLDSLKNHPYYYFILAEYCFDAADYPKALNYYRLYLERDHRQQARRKARQQVENCEFAIKALQHQTKQPTELFFQAERPVYWPSLDISGKTLLFTEQDGDHESMWMLRDSIRYPLHFNVTGNYGAPSLTADGRMMYFSMNGGRNGFDIYVTYRLSDSTWSEPVNLGFPVKTEAWEAQPAISADGTKLYFASTREEGRGGSDIWFSRLLKRESNGRQIWSQPQCLYFNTEGDEMAPFLYFDNSSLFFSSNGYPGMGGKDIYKVDIKEVSTPRNIGITVNSQKDEFGFLVDRSGEWGYFSSDVTGKRCIYRYRLDSQVACPPAAYIRLRVENETGTVIVPDYLVLAEAATSDTLACYDPILGAGEMLACVPVHKLLLVSVNKKGYLYYSDTLSVRNSSSENPYSYTIRLKELHPGCTMVLKGIFFDVDDYRLKPESYIELQQLVKFMRSNPEVCIEISGHTDNTGSDKHNDQLSENRAFEVYKYLFMNRVAKERMVYRGYGKERPLLPNNTEAGRAKNRRTEIRVRACGQNNGEGYKDKE